MPQNPYFCSSSEINMPRNAILPKNKREVEMTANSSCREIWRNLAQIKIKIKAINFQIPNHNYRLTEIYHMLKKETGKN